MIVSNKNSDGFHSFARMFNSGELRAIVPSLDTFGISKLSVRSLLLSRLQVNAIKMIFLLQSCEITAFRFVL